MNTYQFKPGDKVQRVNSAQTYTVEVVTISGNWMFLKETPYTAYETKHFILATGKHDVPQKELTYDEVLGLTQDLEVDVAQSWDFPVFPMPEPRGKCECGSDAINAGSHSTWCPAHQ